MRIEKLSLKAYSWPRPCAFSNSKYTYSTAAFVLARAKTDCGLEGFGLSQVLGEHVPHLPPMLQEIEELLVGTDILNSRTLCEVASLRKIYGRGGLAARCLAAVDIASWDLRGKLADLPICRLLGASVRKLPIYQTCGYYRPSHGREGLRGFESELSNLADMNARLVKIKVGALPLDEDADRIRLAQSVLGDESRLAVDANGAYSLHQILSLLAKLTDVELAWIEEPLREEDESGLKELARRCPYPIALGENTSSVAEFGRLARRRAVGILQPDVSVLGGLTSALSASTIGETFFKTLIPHGSPLIHIHLVATLGEHCMLQWFPEWLDPLGARFFSTSVVADGSSVSFPTEPGLGVQFDEDAARDYRAY